MTRRPSPPGNSPPPACSRRRFLAGGLGLAVLPAWARAFPNAPAAASGRSLIVLWLDGGLSHVDSFDAKPAAGANVRGELRSIETAIPGQHFGELLPRLAARADRCAWIRTLSSGEGQHDRASTYVLSGHRPSPVLDHPSLLAVHARQGDVALPAYVALPDAHAAARQGFLADVHAPFELETDPARGRVAVRDLQPAAGTARRAPLVDRLDALDGGARSASEQARDGALSEARALSMQARSRAVFSLDEEPAALRERYGRSGLGPSLLLARRLVEAGVSSVFVRSRGWDHHTRIAQALSTGFPPPLPNLDLALSALIDDLQQRGLDQRVSVVLASEFGRTPRLNARGGRDHWPRASSAMLFGAGVRAGALVGTTDSRGEEPIERAVSPGELAATVAQLVGLDPALRLQSPDGRPVPLVEPGARAVREVLAG